MKNILVPTDFSGVSRNALSYARSFAKSSGAKITLVHAYHTIPAVPEIPSKRHKLELEELRINSEKKLKSACLEINETCEGMCSYVNQEGYATEIITDISERMNSDLLIMGTENINPIDKIIFGTITGKVLKKVRCPILVIPEETGTKPPEKMAFAIDYHENDIEDIRFMVPLANKLGAELHVLRVASKEEDLEYEDKLMTDFRNKVDHAIHDNRIVWNLLEGKNVVDQLEKYVSQMDIDLIAAAKTKLNPLLRAFFGSVTKKLFYHTHIPLLIFQAEDSDLRSHKLARRSNYE